MNSSEKYLVSCKVIEKLVVKTLLGANSSAVISIANSSGMSYIEHMQSVSLPSVNLSSSKLLSNKGIHDSRTVSL